MGEPRDLMAELEASLAEARAAILNRNLDHVLGDAEAVVLRRDGDRIVVEPATAEVGGFSTARRWCGAWVEEAGGA